ncbi:hypothetical protein [Neisseria meningitidis]|uniref:hypothetical protein n=1 Tax=Neisseria meningitidis TaxID=487 RepID=UPI001C579F05|nr:hypothetical protein [Neisseria meningitidis]MBW3871360.1 hypothetical protein [Neisseria meningitidis]MBW3956264.1 hypothetical protein [Neisseria meningitidis]
MPSEGLSDGMPARTDTAWSGCRFEGVFNAKGNLSYDVFAAGALKKPGILGRSARLPGSISAIYSKPY